MSSKKRRSNNNKSYWRKNLNKILNQNFFKKNKFLLVAGSLKILLLLAVWKYQATKKKIDSNSKK